MGIETLNEDLELNIPMFDDDMDIIAKLDDEPNAVGGLTAAELKAEFDRPGKTIQEYLNKTLIPSLIGTVAEESVRAQNEYVRVTNENQRIINEEAREEAETARSDAENSRKEAETAREQAEEEREKTIKLISDLTVSADTLPAGEKAQVEKTVENGAYSLKLKIPEGKSGRDGDPGPAGADGFTPKITANETTDGYNLLIQNKNDLEMITIKNGKDGNPGPVGKSGSDGAPGSDGVGIKSVVQTELSTEDQGRNTMRITKTDGTTTDFYVFNGRRGSTGPVGQPGKDGRNGNPGKSAYEYAKDGGFTGTEEEFAELLANGNGGGADWDQNDPEGAGYVKGRTHWCDEDGFHPLNGRFLPDSVPWVENYATDILSCEVLLDDNGEAKLDVRPEIFEGGKYVVSWNGAEFNCEARAFEENGAYIGMAIGSGDPFTIILVTVEMVETVGASFLVRGSLDYARTVVDLRISKRGIYYQKLQKELLPDDVPFVYATEQSLTEEQKAQARENIGVENVLESVGGDTLTWDGNTEGLIVVSDIFYKVSDATPTLDDFSNGCVVGANGISAELTFADVESMTVNGLASPGGVACVTPELVGVDIDGLVFPEPGTYFSYIPGVHEVSSITIPGYTGFAKKQVNPEYLPEFSWDNLEDKPFGDVLEEIIPETEMTGVEDSGMYVANLNPSIITGEHEKLVVTFDGVEYSCNVQATPTGFAYGNGALLGLEGNGEPFLIAVMVGMAVLLIMLDGEPHTVKISAPTAQRIDPKYMPATNILYSDGVYAYSSNELVDGKPNASKKITQTELKRMVLSGLGICVSDFSDLFYAIPFSYSFDDGYGSIRFTNSSGNGGTVIVSTIHTAEYRS